MLPLGLCLIAVVPRGVVDSLRVKVKAVHEAALANNLNIFLQAGIRSQFHAGVPTTRPFTSDCSMVKGSQSPVLELFTSKLREMDEPLRARAMALSSLSLTRSSS